VLSKEPSARYRTADQFGRVLVTFSQESSAATAIVMPDFSAANDAVQGEYSPAQASLPPRPALAHGQQLVGSDTAPNRLPRNAPLAEGNPLSIDWLTILLGLLALIAVGGLFPFSLWVYFLYR
jgi:serine/threonine-protein kinase